MNKETVMDINMGMDMNNTDIDMDKGFYLLENE
jgi:hypothetical protein